MKKRPVNGYTTKDDLKRLRKSLVGKIGSSERRLNQKIDTEEKNLNQKIWSVDDKLDNTKTSFETNLTQFKSDILTAIDKVYGELVSFHEEQVLSKGSVK